MYVRRWPRISASSRTPPRLHADELASGRAGDRLADRGLAGAGRADQREDRAGALVLGDAALDAQLLDRQVLDDAVLDVLEAGVVGVEDLARVDGVERPRRSAPSTARRSASPGRTGSSTPRPTARPCARAGRAPWWPAPRPPPACRPRRSWCGTPRRRSAESSPSSRWIDSICLRRKYSRCCLSAPSRTSSRILRRSCSSVSRSRWRRDGELEPLGDVERLEDLRPSPRTRCRARSRSCRPAGRARRWRAARRRRARRRRAARGSPRPRRGTRARARACGRRRGRRRCDSVTSMRRRPAWSVWAAPATPRATPESCTARAPPGRRTLSVTSAMVPTLANALSWRGMSRTRSSSPTSTGSVTSMVGKTTVSSSGTRINEVI